MNKNMTLFDKAIMFATEAHAGQKRKGKDKPYILHPLEAAAIVGRCLDGLRKEEAAAGLLEEKDVILAAAVLHDVVEDRRVQCFIGSQSAWENLKLIPKDALPKVRSLKETDRDDLFRDLEGILPQLWFEKIWEMIWKRWCAYETVCHQK